ncbi:MAG: MoxR family ATPase [Propionibacteriaceae bacterium]|nr:MoxR family ATPase [Propionibacteriaceae bacterium]
MQTVLSGKPESVDLAITALLAGAHLLIEDVPGVGKTTLAKALAKSIQASVHRIQFTPDLLPSDITGVSIYNQHTGAFEFRPGAVFANIVIADEINRASPKTQSALLEAMEERRVSVDQTTYQLAAPFLVVATQNPVEMEGTYPLPESQRDRFGMCVSMGYPELDDEVAILDVQGSRDPLEQLAPVTDAETIREAVEAVNAVWVDPAIKRYLVRIVDATRHSPDCRVGASPRASLQLLRLARARAIVHGRDYVIPDDIQALAQPTLAHRIVLNTEAQLARKPAHDVVADAVAGVAVPGRRRTP